MVKVFVVVPVLAIGSIHRMFNEHKKYQTTTSIKEADLVQFIGGEDVHPLLYGEIMHDSTAPNMMRDIKEAKFFELAKSLDKPMAGICRGGQFLNVMNGGTLYQDVTSHRGNHPLVDALTGEYLEVTSTHHQMMRPGKDAVLMAYAEQGGLKRYMHPEFGEVEIDDESKDTEVLFYEKTKSLCFQPHPEFYQNETRKYYFKMLNACFDMPE